MTAVAYLGKRDVTHGERDEIVYLGQLMAKLDIELHTGTLDGACAAIRAGYEAGGAKAVLHAKGLRAAAPHLILDHDNRLLEDVVKSLGDDSPDITYIPLQMPRKTLIQALEAKIWGEILNA